jgi:hypothetical protein
MDLASFSTISESVAYRNNRLSLGKGFLTQFCNTGRDFGEFLDGN